MLTINLKDVTLQNYTAILSLIKGLNSRTINGADMNALNNADIVDIEMNNFCNIFQVKHMTPKVNFVLTDITLIGKYNLINLKDLPKGTFTIKVNKSVDAVNNLLSIEKRENIDLIFDKLSPTCPVSGVFLVKDQSTSQQINITNLDYTENKVVYLKDINGGTSVDDVEPAAKIELTYDHNKLYLICENVNANITIYNESRQRVINVDKCTNIETFTSSNNITCTSGGEKLIIALIIFAVYKLLTKREIIKIFE